MDKFVFVGNIEARRRRELFCPNYRCRTIVKAPWDILQYIRAAVISRQEVSPLPT